MSSDEYAEGEQQSLDAICSYTIDNIPAAQRLSQLFQCDSSLAAVSNVWKRSNNKTDSRTFITETTHADASVPITSQSVLCDSEISTSIYESYDTNTLKVYTDSLNAKHISFPPEYICRICLEPLRKPMRFSYCMHTFCADCIYYLFSLWEKTCPICNERSIIYDQQTMFPGPRYIQYNPFILHIDEQLDIELHKFMGITPYIPVPGDFVRILAPRELCQFTMIQSYCGVVQDIIDGVISDDLVRILDRETVESMSLNERYKINALHPCKVARVNCYGILWIGRLCELEPFRPNTFVLGTRVIYGSPVIETFKFPDKIIHSLSSLYSVRNFSVQERDLFIEKNQFSRQNQSSLTNIAKEALDYLAETTDKNATQDSASKEFALFCHRQHKWSIGVPYYPHWPKFVPLSLAVKTNIYNNIDVLYRYKAKLKDIRRQRSSSKTLTNIINLTDQKSEIDGTENQPSFNVASLVMDSTTAIPIELYLVKHDLISFDNEPLLGFSPSNHSTLSDNNTHTQLLPSHVPQQQSSIAPGATKSQLAACSNSVVEKPYIMPSNISLQLLELAEDATDSPIVEAFRKKSICYDEIPNNFKDTPIYNNRPPYIEHISTSISPSQVDPQFHYTPMPDDLEQTRKTIIEGDITSKIAIASRRAKARRWPEVLADQNRLIEAAAQRGKSNYGRSIEPDKDSQTIVSNSNADVYDQSYSFPYNENRPTLLSSNLTYCYPSHLRKFLRVITDFSTWYSYRDFCCSGCRGLLRFPVKALCGHYYCYNCYMDCRENNWVCFDCGRVMEHSISFIESSTQCDENPEKASRHSTYIYRKQMPPIDWDKIYTMRKQISWFNCLIDYGFPCVVRGYSQTKIGILLDDPSKVYCHILLGNKHIEVHNIATISAVNVFDLRPALRYGEGLSLTQSHRSQFFNFGICNITSSYLYTDSTIFCATRYSSELFMMGLNMNVMAHKTLRLVEDLEPQFNNARKEGIKRQKDEEQKDFICIWNWCQYERNTAKQQYDMLVYGHIQGDPGFLQRPSFLKHQSPPSSPPPRISTDNFIRRRQYREAVEKASNMSSHASTLPLCVTGYQPNISHEHDKGTAPYHYHKTYNPQASIVTFQYHHRLRPKQAPTTTAYCSKHPLINPNYQNKLVVQDEKILKHRKRFIKWYFDQPEMHPDNTPISFASGEDVAHPVPHHTQMYSLQVKSKLSKYDSMSHIDTQAERLVKEEERSKYVVRSLCDTCRRFPTLKFLCSSCHCVLRRPVRLVCDHIVCRTCACIHLASEIPCLACGVAVTDISKVHYEVDLENQIIHAVNHMFYIPKFDVGVIVKSTDSSNTGMVVSMVYLQGMHYAYVAFFGAIKLCRCIDLVILEPDWRTLDIEQILANHSEEFIVKNTRQSSFHRPLESFFKNQSTVLRTLNEVSRAPTIIGQHTPSRLSRVPEVNSDLTSSAIELRSISKPLSNNLKDMLLSEPVDSKTLALLGTIYSVSTTTSGTTSSGRSKSASTPLSYNKQQQISGMTSSTTESTMFLSLPVISDTYWQDENPALIKSNKHLLDTPATMSTKKLQGNDPSYKAVSLSVLDSPAASSDDTFLPDKLSNLPQSYKSSYRSERLSHPGTIDNHQQHQDLYHTEKLVTSPRGSSQNDCASLLHLDDQPALLIKKSPGKPTKVLHECLTSSNSDRQRSAEAFSLCRSTSAPAPLSRNDFNKSEKLTNTEFMDIGNQSQCSSVPYKLVDQWKKQESDEQTISIDFEKTNMAIATEITNLKRHGSAPLLTKRAEAETDTDIGMPFIEGTRVTKLKPYFYDGEELLKVSLHRQKQGTFNISIAGSKSARSRVPTDDCILSRGLANGQLQYPQLGDVFVVANGPYKGLLGLTQSYAKTYDAFILSYYCLLETGTAHEFRATDLRKITLMPSVSTQSIRKQLASAKGADEDRKKLHWYRLIMQHEISTVEKLEQLKHLFNLQGPDEIVSILRAKETTARSDATTLATISGVEEIKVSPRTNLNTILDKKIVFLPTKRKHPDRRRSQSGSPPAIRDKGASIHSSGCFGLRSLTDEMISPLCRSFSVHTPSRASLMQEFISVKSNSFLLQHLNLNAASSLPKVVVVN